jgi:flagellum-specific peptidoglycan hydrolase FlgJ
MARYSERAKKFPKEVLHAAQASERATGCPACVSLGQWALESGYGKSALAKFNPFGMKWYRGCKFPYVSFSTKEYVNKQWITIEAKFQSFPDLATAFIEHGKLLMNPRGPYKRARPFAKDWLKFVEMIGPVYATDPKYFQKLTSIIQTYALYDYNLPESG